MYIYIYFRFTGNFCEQDKIVNSGHEGLSTQETSMISMLPEKLDWLPTLPSSSRDLFSDMMLSPNSIWQLLRLNCFSKGLSSCQLRRESTLSLGFCRLRTE